MPIYEFTCKQCGKEFEFLCFRKDEDATCPSCGGKDTERLLSTFSCSGGKSMGSGDASALSGCAPSGGFS
jgi:putative FmdB family regulatory protein